MPYALRRKIPGLRPGFTSPDEAGFSTNGSGRHFLETRTEPEWIEADAGEGENGGEQWEGAGEEVNGQLHPGLPPGFMDPEEAGFAAESGGRHTLDTFTQPGYFETGPGAGESWEGAGEEVTTKEFPTALVVGGVLAVGALAFLLWR